MNQQAFQQRISQWRFGDRPALAHKIKTFQPDHSRVVIAKAMLLEIDKIEAPCLGSVIIKCIGPLWVLK